jgi:hypothetical protein
VRQLRDRLDEGILNATIIVAELDEEGRGGIYLIEDPGDCVLCDAEGFVTTGMGSEHATSVFAEVGYTENMPWTEALLLVYLAKKRAESAPGVGEATDINWINVEHRAYIEPRHPIMNELEKIRRDRDRRMRRAFYDGHRRISKQLEEFNESPEENTSETISVMK